MDNKKEKVLTTKGVLEFLNVSNGTFYKKYKPFIKPIGKYGYTHIYKLKDVENIKKNIKAIKSKEFNYDIIA